MVRNLVGYVLREVRVNYVEVMLETRIYMCELSGYVVK